MRTRVIGAAGTAAAAGVAVGVLVSSSPDPRPAPVSGGGTRSGVGPIRLAAQQTLLSLSAAAAATPRPSGRYVVQTENTDTTDVYPAGTQTTAGTTLKHQVIFTETGTLRAALLAEANQQMQVKFMSPPLPTDDDMVFEQAAQVLWDPNLNPDLYKVLAATPGVQVKSDATDSSGRPAVEISCFEAWSKQEVESFEDAKTGATLESAWVGPTANYAEDLCLSVTYTATVAPDPYES
jgi:hypothetical protein